MKLQQLSLFLENRPGQIKVPCRILGESGIDIVTLSLADTQQFGILRLIVADWERAKKVLEAAGCVVNITEVVPIGVVDRPGGLADVLEAVDRAGLGIEYMYAFAAGKRGDEAALIFRFEEPDRAVRTLKEKGVRILDAETLFARVAR